MQRVVPVVGLNRGSNRGLVLGATAGLSFSVFTPEAGIVDLDAV
jgi:hypothetical protein